MTSQDTSSSGSPQPAVQKRSRAWGVLQIALWILAALLAAAIGGALATFQAYESALILPGVQALGVDLGQMTRLQAAVALQQAWEAQRITIVLGDTTAYRRPEELGLLLDTDEMTHEAFNLSRTPESLSRLLLRGPRQVVPPDWHVDATSARTFIVSAAKEYDRPAVDASFSLTDGQIETTASRSGRAVDVNGSLEWLQQNGGQVLDEGRWELLTSSVPPEVFEVDAAVAEAENLLQRSISLELYDPIAQEEATWRLSPADWSSWLQLRVDESDPARVRWELDEDAARADLNVQLTERYPGRYLQIDDVLFAVQRALDGEEEAARLRLYHRETLYTVQAGDMLSSIGVEVGIPYPWIQQANPDMDTSVYAGQVITIPSPDVLLPLPVVESKRITVSLSTQTLYVYEDGELLWEWPCSTGLPTSPTAPGIFQVQEHELNAYAPNWDLWMPHFLAIYRPVPDAAFMNGIHGFPSRGDDQLLWVNQLGSPITFGCIMISSDNAQTLYDWAEEGTIVEIRQ